MSPLSFMSRVKFENSELVTVSSFFQNLSLLGRFFSPSCSVQSIAVIEFELLLPPMGIGIKKTPLQLPLIASSRAAERCAHDASRCVSEYRNKKDVGTKNMVTKRPAHMASNETEPSVLAKNTFNHLKNNSYSPGRCHHMLVYTRFGGR